MFAINFMILNIACLTDNTVGLKFVSPHKKRRRMDSEYGNKTKFYKKKKALLFNFVHYF